MKKKLIGVFVLSVIFWLSAFKQAEASTITVNKFLGDEVLTSEGVILPDVTSNLLVDSDGIDLLEVTSNKRLYKLESVDVTRQRQKVVVEYYKGDFNTYEKIGEDAGYADYEDYISSYLMNMATINTTFGQSFTSGRFGDKLFNLDGGSGFGSVGTPEENGPVLTKKVLVATPKTYHVNAAYYQNKQDALDPNPIGLLKTALSTKYWTVMNKSTTFKGVPGQTITLQDVGQFEANYTVGGRAGDLVYTGMFDLNTGEFQETTTLKIPADLTTTIYDKVQFAAFYKVDDYGSEVKNPGTQSGMVSEWGVGLTGAVPAWRNDARVTETLLLANEAEAAKLVAYPFNLDGDPFTNPEIPIEYVNPNWVLGHNLTIDYHYDAGTPIVEYYKVTFETNGGSVVAPLTKVAENTSIAAPAVPTKVGFKFAGWYQEQELTSVWDFATAKVTEDMTLYAKWTKDPVVPGKPDSKPKPKPGAKNPKLPQTGEIIGYSAMILGVILVVGVGIVFYKKKKHN